MSSLNPFLQAKLPTIQKLECADNEFFKHWGVVEACEARTMKYNMGLVNVKLVIKRPIYPDIVSI